MSQRCAVRRLVQRVQWLSFKMESWIVALPLHLPSWLFRVELRRYKTVSYVCYKTILISRSLPHRLLAVDVCKNCDPYAKCINNTCICNPGYKGDGFHCERKFTVVQLLVTTDFSLQTRNVHLAMHMQLSTFSHVWVKTKQKAIIECLRYFWLQKFRHIWILVKSNFTRTFNVDLRLCLYTPEKGLKSL